jgi:hypothetical protein
MMMVMLLFVTKNIKIAKVENANIKVKMLKDDIYYPF